MAGGPLRSGAAPARLTAVGLFAGIGGVEAGLAQAGIETVLCCEVADPARRVLAAQWPELPLAGDIVELSSLPEVDVISAGFPCQDLSQAGRTAGITGERSGLVGHVFRLLDAARRPPTWVVFENVKNMLPLDAGRAMRYLVGELEVRGYRWAYRVVDARFTGVPQRRQRVLLVASRTADPADVLFADDAGEPDEDTHYRHDAYGFYWTEGVRGLGWARDAVPTLKGGSGFGIPSPPAIWLPGSPLKRRFVTPDVKATEILQGFEPDWTASAQRASRNPRWTLVGNAVTVPVAGWLGRRLVTPGRYVPDPDRERPLTDAERWPSAARGERGTRYRVAVSMWPERLDYRHLTELIPSDLLRPLSHKAAAGFLQRTGRGSLRFVPEFLADLKRYVRYAARPTARARPIPRPNTTADGTTGRRAS